MERREEKTIEIPFDLTRQILLRLPAKSLMRFRCVSQLWASVTSDPEFIVSFATHSRSSLLLNFQRNDEQLFYSLSQQKPFEMEKYPLTLQTKQRYKPHLQFQSVHGLIAFHYLNHTVIWNPSIGQHATFQKPDKPFYVKNYLGYDPIGDTYKLLCISYSHKETHVLTLGAQEPWRQIEGVSTWSFPRPGICINGVLYFNVNFGSQDEVMSFDVRTEKFKSIQRHHCKPSDLKTKFSLVSYKGRLASIILESSVYKLWILEDADKGEWSCQDFDLPLSPEDPIAKAGYSLTGVTDDGEFIYVSVSWEDKEIHVYYYNVPNSKSNRRISIKRFEDDDDFWLRDREDGNHGWKFLGIMPNHMENLMSLESLA